MLKLLALELRRFLQVSRKVMNEQFSHLAHNQRDSNRHMVLICYVLGVLGVFFFITACVALFICYLKREDAMNTIYQSHYTWLISTFWVAVVGSIVSFLTLFIALGFVLYFILSLWLIYRFTKGLLRFLEHKAVA